MNAVILDSFFYGYKIVKNTSLFFLQCSVSVNPQKNLGKDQAQSRWYLVPNYFRVANPPLSILSRPPLLLHTLHAQAQQGHSPT